MTPRRIAWAVFAFAIVWVSVSALWPHYAPPTPRAGYADKVQHAVVWAVLALALWAALRSSTRRAWPFRMGLAWAALVVYGALVEVLQTLVPGRSAEWLDLAADAIGAALGCLVMLGLERGYDGARSRKGRAARDDAALQGLGPGGGAADAAEQPRPGRR